MQYNQDRPNIGLSLKKENTSKMYFYVEGQDYLNKY